MKARHDELDHADYRESQDNADVYGYFCFEKPLDAGMYKEIPHEEKHDEDTCVSYYSFHASAIPIRLWEIVIVETP